MQTTMSLKAIHTWYRRLPPSHRSVAFGVLGLVPVLITSLVSYFLKETIENSTRIKLVGVLLVFFLFMALKRYVEFKTEAIDRAAERQRNALGQAQESFDAITASGMAQLHALSTKYEQGEVSRGKELLGVLIGGIAHIQILVDSLYQVMQAQFARSGDLMGEIDFEVTFMTKSYRDNEITIYAHCNRDHRAPRSLLLRADDPSRYRCTVTKEIYEQAKPEMKIISDTWTTKYEAVYPGQLDRIRSSVVYPVLSDRSELLGTLVVHCNEECFFKEQESLFWRRLLELYAKQVAYAKIRLDIFSRVDLNTIASELSVEEFLPDR